MPKRGLIKLVCTCVITSVAALVSHLGAVQIWLFTGSMPAARYDHVAHRLSDGRVFVAGEGNSGAAAAFTSTFFNPATGTWSAGPPPSQVHQDTTSVRLADGRILVAGGRTGSTPLANAEIFDPATNAWSSTGSLNIPRTNHTLTLLPNGKVLAAGGYNFGFESSSELYDPSTGGWTMTGSMAVGKWLHTATLLTDGRVLVAGGEQYFYLGGDQIKVVEIYDTVSGTWTPGPFLAVGRAAHLAARLPDGRVIVMGGLNGGPLSYNVTSTTEIFDPASSSWTFGASMANGRFNSPALAEMADGTLLVTGGQISTSPAIVTASAERYNAATNTWTSAASMNQPRQYHTATPLPNGSVLVAGGYNGSTLLSSSELLIDDNAPPSTTVFLTPSANGNGWNNSDVVVTLNASDAGGSGVQSIAYNVLGPQSFSGSAGGSFAQFTIASEGQTDVGYHAVDQAGNVESQRSIVLRIDKTAPFVSPLPDITVNATQPGGAFVSFNASATDGTSGIASVQTSPLSSGQLFPIGTTHITVTATDAAGNATIGGFNVTVNADTTAPTSTHSASPPNANGWNKFSVFVGINAIDDPGGQGVQSISYTLSGAQTGSFTSFGNFASFNINNQGITTVAYHATDNAGNVEADHVFTVRYDQTQPVVDPISNITVNATSSSGAVVNFNVVASDAPSGIDTIVMTPKASGSIFPHGTTNQSVTVTDKAGNSTFRSFSVTVNKVLTSIDVLPGSATIDPGQSQQFQAQGVFTDGSSATLPTSGGGGGPTVGSSSWNIHFDTPLNVSQCGSVPTFTSQGIGGPSTPPFTVDTNWGSPQTVHAAGSITASTVSLTLTCINGQGSPGSLNASWTGTRYAGSWSFSDSSGGATVRGWSSKTSAPTARYGIGAATVNGIVYVMGRDNPSAPAPVEAYDIAAGTWSTVSVMPTSREGAGYAELNGRIYVAGGHVSGGGGTNTVDVFDPAGNTWTSASPMSTVRAQFQLIAAGGRLYAIGGETGANGAPLTATVESYDPANNTWSPKASMSTARKFHAAGALNGGTSIVVAGGIGSPTSTELYNVSTNAWSNGPAPQFAIGGAGAVVVNNALFVVGGTSNGGTGLTQMFRPVNGFSPAGWALPGDMPTGRGELAVAAAGGASDVLYAIGGLRAGSPVATVEAMSTPPPTDLAVSSGGGFTLPTVSWSSTDASVANISSSGQAFGSGGGETTIIATAAGISCQTTNSCGTLTVRQPPPEECAEVVLTITPVGMLPFNTVNLLVEGESDAFPVPFGENHFEVEAATYTVHFQVPAGYTASPGTITFTIGCGGTAQLNVTVEAEDDDPPVVTLPANIVAPATEPAGAIVSYTASAIDAVDGPVPITCLPASGSLFLSGMTTTVHCSAWDTHGNSASGSFTVTVLNASQMVTGLIGEIENFQQAANLLDNVLNSISKGNTGTACDQLAAFIYQVRAQEGKKVTQAEAATLIAIANQAKAALGCP